MKKISLIPLGLSTLLSVALTAPVMASDRTCAYAYDSADSVVRDSAGNCLRSGSWRPEGMTVECGAEPPKPEPVAEPAPPPAPKPAPKPVMKTVSLSAGALFDVNSADLKPAGKAELDALAAHMKAVKVERIDINGYTDSTGSAEYNKQLSMRRANAVKDYLLGKGIDPRIMTTMGWGEENPVADNSTAAGRAANRRVEITLHGVQQMN